MATFDIILDVDGELIHDGNGDFLSGENDNNLIYYNVVSHQGHFRTAPTLGAGVDKYLNADILSSVVERNIRASLKNDIFPNADVNTENFPEIVINKELVINNGTS